MLINYRNRNVKLISANKLSALALMIMMTCSYANAEDEFNLNALSHDTPLADTDILKEYISNNDLMEGEYLTTVYFNLNYVEKVQIKYALTEDKSRLNPVFTKAELRRYGINVDAIPGFQNMSENATISDINKYIEGASYTYSTQTQRLDIRIPQIALSHEARDAVSPELWDDGIPALMLGYYYSGSQSHYRHATDGKKENNFLSLNTGANYGGWRLRNTATYSESWDNISTTLSHDIKKLRSQFLIGDSSTPSDIFDSVQFRGIRIYSDNDMLPYSKQGFAPVIRGIAHSDAKVTVKQNGYKIYETYVTPGPFEITDINQVSSGSDFDIIVTEADGSEHSFTQTSSSLPVMLRSGSLNYSMLYGKYQSNDVFATPDFGQTQIIYGLPWGVTAYSGLMGADCYQSTALGMGVDLHSMGSISFDATYARSELNNNQDNEGISYRLQYAKNIGVTDTNLTLASYRYSSKNFYTFSEAISQRNQSDIDDDMYAYRNMYNRRSRAQVTLNQTVGNWGNIALSAYQQDYWQLKEYERNITLGYNVMWHDISFSLNASQTKTPYSQRDSQVAFSVSVPLSRWLPQAWATYSFNHSRQGGVSHQVGINGVALEDNKLSYSIQQAYSNQDNTKNGNLSTSYRGSAATVSGGYNYNDDSQQINYSAQGGVVLHPYGITLAQTLPETMTLVRAPGASNVRINSSSGIYTDKRGYAIVPYSNPYRQNTVSLDTSGNRNTDISEPIKIVIPTRGAVVLADYKVRTGARVLFTLLNDHGLVPFGALVTTPDDNDNPASLVDDHGQVYISGVTKGMKIVAKWGSENTQTCSAQVDTLSITSDLKAPVIRQTLHCH